MNLLTSRIVIISPVRNEEKFISGIIESVINQTLKPIEWIIVDDGSSDRTYEIASKAAAEYDWIRVIKKQDRGFRSVGPGVVQTFYYGYERINSDDYDYVCKMDGDLELKPTYFETLISYFDQDPYLGAASGKPFLEDNGKLIEERTHREMVAGQINFYRRKCFEDIGGFVREVHWDGIAFHRARMEGWRTRSICHQELNYVHKRLMGSSGEGIIQGRLRWGKGQYFMGTHPLFLLAITVYRMREKPFFIGGLCIFIGYCRAFLTSMPRYDDSAFRKSLHAWQMERLKLGKRLEVIPEVPNSKNISSNSKMPQGSKRVSYYLRQYLRFLLSKDEKFGNSNYRAK
ncbi:family 2 glycosyl transferase [Chondrocystis sp. NIES-4102]|nr:family 2 glycosyl transferase [Chondrocystis sp. NIES-4102]